MRAPGTAFFDVPYVTHPEQTHRVACYSWGDAAATPVVCVHGLTRNGHDFDALADNLADHFHVIALDMPGRGNSEWLKYPEEYNAVSYITNIQFILAKLNISACHWIGTSMGGIVGMLLAAQMPERIRSLTLNDVGTRIPGSALARIAGYVGKAVHFPNRAVAERALRDIYAPFGITREEVWQHLFKHDLQELPDGSVRRAYDPAIGATMNADPAQPDMDLSEAWKKVQCPALIIRGGKSDLLLADTANEMQQLHPGTVLHTVPNAGHAPTLADAAEIELIRRWLLEQK